MASFQFTDPKTGIKYTGPDASARWAAYLQQQQGPGKGLPAGMNTIGPPPVGTYDPGIDYNASAANRGYEQNRDDASTSFEQGQQDYGLGIGDLTRGRDRSLADLLTGESRMNEDYQIQGDELDRQFGILGGQQAQNAARQGITSQGLLGKSAAVRDANKARDQNALDLSLKRGTGDIATGRARVGEDFDRGKLGLDLGNARSFGGFQGNTLTNPITGMPQVGSLLTSLTRAGTENNAYQTFSAGQRASQAAANGYVPPGFLPAAPGSRQQAAQSFGRRLRIT